MTWTLTDLVLSGKAAGSDAASERLTVIDMVRVGLTVAAGIGGAVALVVAYRKQHLLEVDPTAFNNRYAAAAQQLGDPQAAVRLAGVYAMTALADDWAERRQQCVDVLCAYLRLPWTEPDGPEPDTTVTEHSTGPPEDQHRTTKTYQGRVGEREVRRTLIRIIRDHLQADAAVSWSRLDFDLTRACLPDATFAGATFNGQNTSFGRATFNGQNTSFAGATFNGQNTSFAGATFNGQNTSFGRATFNGQSTNFFGATFNGQYTNFFGATFNGQYTNFDGATFNGQNTNFFGATFRTGVPPQVRPFVDAATLTDQDKPDGSCAP